MSDDPIVPARHNELIPSAEWLGPIRVEGLGLDGPGPVFQVTADHGGEAHVRLGDHTVDLDRVALTDLVSALAAAMVMAR